MRAFFLVCHLKYKSFKFGTMKKGIIYTALGVLLLSGVYSCKVKHCAALQDDFEGYSSKKVKKKRGRQEGLFSKQKRRY
jgi:hypothetical protein